MRQFRIVDVAADSASVVGDQFREFVEAVGREEFRVGVGVVEYMKRREAGVGQTSAR